MDQTIPDWLNKTFLSTCLQGNGPDASPVTINWYDVTAGVAPGNNYGSVILRVKVKYREENRDKDKSLIIKGPISNSLVDAIVELFGMAEYSFYYLYLPKLADIIKDWITPKAYHTPMSSVIVLEDLSELGFTMADRQKQLDFDHCKQYFAASAKFHAAGVVLANQHPELIEKFPGVLEKMIKSSDYSQLNLFMHDILVGLKCLIKSIEVLGLDEYKPYLETIRKFVELNENPKDNVRELGLRKMAETNKKMFKSFIHGDCWTTNMMFKHNQSGPGPTDIRLIDFQGFRYDSVVSDIP
ncbi:uncharacterized protein LOC128987072 [Macrosteles quadrilineatus]|uniref:uncharacterized protein LOC128987072 n=1 Tax=Macrosteles quadrilineatus TaxID=74068 RepID=UPI0023E15AAD|nr:uncharacterized protein LOC128987072 [Macrosteles quadrilineatus]